MIVLDKPKLKFLASARSHKMPAYKAFRMPRRGSHRPGLGSEGMTSMQGQNTAGVDAAFGNWLAGFIDGEGCFSIRIAKGLRAQSHVCEFHITLRQDDAAIIREIAHRTGLGRIYYYDTSSDTRNSQPAVRWTVSRRGQLLELIRLLDAHPLRAKKARDYRVWREAVGVWAQTRRGGFGGEYMRRENAWIWARMHHLREEMTHVRAYEQEERSPAEPSAQLELGS